MAVLDAVRRGLVEGRTLLPGWGAVVPAAVAVPPFLLVDDAGRVVTAAADYLRDLTLSDASSLTVRSYAFDLLRWWRLLEVLAMSWEVATRADVEVLVGWMRSSDNPQRHRSSGSLAGSVNAVTGKRNLRLGYAPRTINHQLAVLASFYGFHAAFGNGPLLNPVPGTRERRESLAQPSLWEARVEARRAPLRQRVERLQPRSIPDANYDALMSRMGSHRDRALLTMYVSSGARASELLGVRAEQVDWARQRVFVVTKGSRLLEPVPVSPEALRHLARYYDEHGTPAVGEPVFRTVRGRPRPLTYSAARRVLQRANEALGTNWTLHDLRHTLVCRLATDPDLTLPEIMTVTRHRRVESMTPYLQPRVDEVFDKLQEHLTRPKSPRTYTAGYDAEDMRTVFGA